MTKADIRCAVLSGIEYPPASCQPKPLIAPDPPHHRAASEQRRRVGLANALGDREIDYRLHSIATPATVVGIGPRNSQSATIAPNETTLNAATSRTRAHLIETSFADNARDCVGSLSLNVVVGKPA